MKTELTLKPRPSKHWRLARTLATVIARERIRRRRLEEYHARDEGLIARIAARWDERWRRIA